jgi:hypothetical protein
MTDDLPPVGRLLDLAGRVAIVTGASGGVGAGIADGSPHVTGIGASTQVLRNVFEIPAELNPPEPEVAA